MKFIRGILHIITILGALAAVWTVNFTMNSPQVSAIQESAGVAYALSFVIIPYCLARTVEQLTGRSS
jgi:hypothetical protein